MRIDFDPEKSNKNTQNRGLPFHRASEFEWETALYFEDVRRTYPEQRYIALGYLDDRLHVLCFSYIENGVRIISFRKANLREVRRYEKKTINE